MNQPHDLPLNELPPDGEPVNVSRRRFLLASAGTAAGSLVVGFTLPAGNARAQASATPAAPGTRVPAFLEIRDKLQLLVSHSAAGAGQQVRREVRSRVGVSKSHGWLPDHHTTFDPHILR